MKTGLHQHTALRQDLRINPRLYQAMDLLYMPLLDLQQHLKQELLGNPFLEMLEPEEETEAPAPEQKPAEKEKSGDDEPDWEAILMDDRTEHGVPNGTLGGATEYVEPVTGESKGLIDHRWSDLGKRFGLAPDEVQRAADELARLDPKPGLQHSAGDDAYIIPDLIVDKIDDKYHVFLNDGGLPRLRISRTYQEIARDKKEYDG